jgi:thioredoxin reductase
MIYDLAIIGGGPAGVSAGVYAARKKLKTVFITKNWEGQSSFSEGIENWIGTIKISGLDLAKNLENHLKAYAKDIVDIKEGELCEKIERGYDDGIYKIKTKTTEYRAKKILITTGSSRKKLPVTGADKFEHKGLTYCASCDGPLFADQDVVVVGGGNAAFESASQLLAYCKSVTLINRSDSFRADQVTIDNVSKNPNFKIIKNAIPKEVKGDKFVNAFVYTDALTKKDIELNVTGIFVEIGSIPNTGFVKDIVDLDEWGHIVTSPKDQRTSEVGIWAAGDCTDGLYNQNNIAAGDAIKALEDIYINIKTR